MYAAVREQGVGVLPLVLAGGAVIAGTGLAIGVATARSVERGWIDNLLQVVGLKPMPALPKTTDPHFLPPPAPQTEPKLRNWTPNDLDEAVAQRYGQYRIDEARRLADMQGGGSDPDTAGSTDYLPLIVLGAAVVIGAVAVTR